MKSVYYITVLLSSIIAVSDITMGEPEYIPASQIGTEYILLGLTGEPIGKTLNVEGVVTKPHPNGGIKLHVHKLNGAIVEKRIILNLSTSKNIDFRSYLNKRVKVTGEEVCLLQKIKLINQTDRSKIGNVGSQISLSVEEMLELIDPQGK